MGSVQARYAFESAEDDILQDIPRWRGLAGSVLFYERCGQVVKTLGLLADHGKF